MQLRYSMFYMRQYKQPCRWDPLLQLQDCWYRCT